MPDAIERLNQALRGRYRIERELGEGGMATVYLADDLRHERKVALKVLRPDLAAVVGAERFLAEIKTTANLQHPHILPLFDSGEADGFLYYVMPWVDGESLRDRIERERQLPVDEAIRIATDVAEALHAAHELGVIHRDIKPANILLSRGRPLVADFGIALAVGKAGGTRLTETGLSVGTPYYMSPEQATGDQPIGPASDIYALSCVLYEMLVGEPPHSGSTAQAVLGKILAGEPVSPTRHRPTVPTHVDAAIRRGLERLPADRFTSVHSFARALGDPSFRHGEPATARSRPTLRWKAAALAGWAAALLGLVVAMWPSGEGPRSQVVRAQVPTPTGREWGWAGGINLALSPDGSTVVYVGDRQLLLRRLDGLTTEPINGTDRARNPAISPDGSTLAFVARGSLRTTSMRGGPVTVLVSRNVRDARAGVTWGTDELIYFVDMRGSVRSVPAEGGETVEVAIPDEGYIYAWIDALPAERGLLLTIVAGGTDLSRIAVLDFESGAVRPLFPGTTARYVSSGHLVYATADSLLHTVPFDLDALEATGPSVTLIDRVDVHQGSASQFAVARDGTLAYVTGSIARLNDIVRIDRGGNVVEVDPDWLLYSADEYSSLALSPDGNLLAVTHLLEGSWDLWVKPLSGEPPRRVTLGEASISTKPAWSPDGRSLAFVSDRAGAFDGWSVRSDGGGGPTPILDSDAMLDAITYSPDGEWIVFGTVDGTDDDIYRIAADGRGEATPLAATQFSEVAAAVSPDGRWLAYASNQTGRYEVYVASFPDPAAAALTVVSTGGGREPVWAHNGSELFYRSAADELVSVRFSTRGGAFEVTGREPLFRLVRYPDSPGHAQYAVAPSDESFYMFRRLPQQSTAVLMVVSDLFEKPR